MNDTLRDQLLKAGLVTEKQARQASQPPRKHERQRKQQPKPETLAVQQARAAKLARDRELEQARRQKVEARARAAEIKQLLDEHALPRAEGEEYFNFVAGRKIRRIAVDAGLLERLGRGEIMIIRHEGRSALVSAEIAERIRERDERAVIAFAAAPANADEDDPYKDFVVPDDLRW